MLRFAQHDTGFIPSPVKGRGQTTGALTATITRTSTGHLRTCATLPGGREAPCAAERLAATSAGRGRGQRARRTAQEQMGRPEVAGGEPTHGRTTWTRSPPLVRAAPAG